MAFQTISQWLILRLAALAGPGVDDALCAGSCWGGCVPLHPHHFGIAEPGLQVAQYQGEVTGAGQRVLALLQVGEQGAKLLRLQGAGAPARCSPSGG